jgi:hypothetical protein
MQDGQWREVEVAGENGMQGKLYFSRDKNGKQNRIELLTKWVASWIKEAHPNAKIVAKRAEGRVYIGWTPLARVIVETPTSHRIEWNKPLAQAQAIDIEKVQARINAKAGESESEIPWG